MQQTFSIHIDIDETLTVDEIWPDGDAPENPTADDVRVKLFGEKGVKYDDLIGDIEMVGEVRVSDVRISKHDMARLERDQQRLAAAAEKLKGKG